MILDARYRNDRPTLIVTNLSIREKCVSEQMLA